MCTVPLHQHFGSKIEPLVGVGDRVREGMVIGRGRDRFSTLVHAPIPGIVSRVGRMRSPDGSWTEAVVIELSGEFDQLGKPAKRHDWEELGPDSLVELIEEAGVVGLGRAPLPLHLEIKRYTESESPILVLDLAESEPYGFALGPFMDRFGQQVLEGLAVVARTIGAVQVSVGAVRTIGRYLSAIRRECKRRGYSVFSVNPLYPSNLDAHLRRRVSGEGWSIDPDRDVMILDPNSALAVFEAVVRHKPQIDRIVTINGDVVANPALLRVRLGTPVSVALEECGGVTEVPDRIVVGHGGMTGRPIANVQQPITKTTATVVALSASTIRDRTETPCIGCGNCARSCPVELDPILLYSLLDRGNDEEARLAGLDACTECGACSYVCPSNIPLAHRFMSHREEPA